MKNESGLKPMEYKVLVLPDVVEEKTKGGIYLPEQSQEREKNASMEGTLVEASPIAFKFEDNAPVPPVGSRVIFAKYSGVTIKGADGRDYRIMNDKDVVGARDV